MRYKIKEDGTEKVIGCLNTDTAIFLAADDVLGQNNCTRNNSIFMTPRSKRFFLLHRTMWQGESDYVQEVSKESAIAFVRLYADNANEVLEQLQAELIKDIE